ncbi:MAG TPA: alpha/beta hydrolase [Streptosporangiaceae bacterium]|nr:alpha/beta hydrolase [Streptosporangiaceae bacterium]
MTGADDLLTMARSDSRNRSLVLLLPGITANRQQWSAVISRLADVPADIAHGAPILPSPAMAARVPTVTQVIEALAGELRRRAYDHVVIVSHSVGSFVALGIAHVLPDGVDHLILINGGLTSVARFLDRPVHEILTRPVACLTFVRLFALVALPAPERLRRAAVNHRWFSQAVLGTYVSDSAIATQEKRSALLDGAGRPEVVPSLWKNRHHWREFISYADDIRTDALFVVGSKDPMSTEQDTRAMAALLPSASVRLLRGIGHAAPLEAAEVIAGLVRKAVGAPESRLGD